MQSLLRYTLIAVTVLSITVSKLLAVSDPLTEIPAANLTAVSQLAGLDDQTLAVASVTSQQQKRIIEHLETSIKRQRPKLFTYRALLSETIERYENLKASAAENAFDPCLFVTDEALEKARAAVQEAKEKFEQQCRMVSDDIDTFLEPDQCMLVRNARDNHGLIAPYRWLSLGQESRKQIRRFQQVHQARLELAKKYQHLKNKISPKDLENQIAGILTKEQLTALDVLKEKVQQTKSNSKAGDDQ